MNRRVEEVKLGTNNELIWLLEHPTTYSAGIRFNKKDILKKIGVNPQSGKKSSLGMRPEHEQKLQSILDDIKRAGIK